MQLTILLLTTGQPSCTVHFSVPDTVEVLEEEVEVLEEVVVVVVVEILQCNWSVCQRTFWSLIHW